MFKLSYFTRATSMMLLLAAARNVEAGDGRRLPESDLAAPGAPLYEAAVNESVKTLMSKQEQEALDAQGRPPSPGPDYFWCENCKTYHKRPQNQPQQQTRPAGANTTPGSTPAASPQAAAGAAEQPPSPGPDYYWCANCRKYHRKPTPEQVQQEPAAPAERPPSPGPDHYWCENCKTYHLRKAAEQTTVGQPARPQTNTGTSAAPSASEFYYCEKCKTYHRRLPPSQQQLHISDTKLPSPNPNPLPGSAEDKP